METETKKNEEITIKGKVRAGLADLPEVIISKIGDKPIAKFAVFSKEGNENKITYCTAWDSNIPKVDKLIKDDLVEIKGYYGKEYSTKTGETKKDFIVKECVKLNMVIKGNIGQGFDNNPPVITKDVNGKKVANFSICVNENTEDKKWYNCQAWGDTGKIVEKFQKGDFVELKGHFGKPYSNKKGEFKQDFIISSSNLIISAEERVLNKKKEDSLNEKDKALVIAVKKGDYISVENAIKNGANPDSISKEDYKYLSEKTKSIIENTIDKSIIDGVEQEEKKKIKLSL